MATFEVIFIFALIVLQIYVFANVWQKIKAFKTFFPKSSFIKIKRFQISNAIISDPDRLDKYLSNLSGEKLSNVNDSEDNVELLEMPKKGKYFSEVIKSTNFYLCKNRGAAADFNILKDISERHLEKFDSEIGNLINVPLYIGLGGTFVGIIVGLLGIVGWDGFLELFGIVRADKSIEIFSQGGISQLLQGVIFAMTASFVGLFFTVINSAFYKSAAFQNDTDKNNYYDLLQRELLPSLNTGVAKSLTTLNYVMNDFIRKFGENMGDYIDSGQLLNENLGRQQHVLEEINRLSFTRTAIKIAEVFVGLNESSQHLAKFQEYQKGLNNYVDKTERVTHEMDSIIENFKDFNINLKAIGNNTIASIELQKQFKDSLEKHFPTINDHREIWREQIDELNQDVKTVYTELYKYFQTQTEQLKGFVSDNNDFFNGIAEIQKAIQIFVANSEAQKQEFSILQKQIVGLRSDFKDSQKQSIEVNKDLIAAIIDLKKVIRKPSNSKEN
ncbi:hypothetical protein SAMD00024442_37_20 [Candidatus Symbiothrix dinenymphae]|nr:hypothetical protein SAMD00024442_37_20 [Candidatus Symbiothrix dinenymphae]